jgi:RNA polymerase sigma-70 factor (ECF subfamily)
MTGPDDRSLVRDCLAGDARSFEVLVDRYYKLLFNVAWRMLHDAEDARDVTQGAFLKAYEKLATYDPKHKFFSWIYRILVNESLNFQQRRKPQEPLDGALVARQKGPDEEYEERRVSEAIGAALMRLSIDHREVLILRHFLALSYAEMSSVLGIPEKTVKSRLFAARKTMGGILVDLGAATRGRNEA